MLRVLTNVNVLREGSGHIECVVQSGRAPELVYKRRSENRLFEVANLSSAGTFAVNCNKVRTSVTFEDCKEDFARLAKYCTTRPRPRECH